MLAVDLMLCCCQCQNERVWKDAGGERPVSLLPFSSLSSLHSSHDSVISLLAIFIRTQTLRSTKCDRLPHLKHSIVALGENDENTEPCMTKPQSLQERARADRVLPQSERCWRALLLKDADAEQAATNEWEIVLEHFQKSRSRRVLTIIQQ